MTNKYDDARQNAQNWYDSDMGHMNYLEAIAAEAEMVNRGDVKLAAAKSPPVPSSVAGIRLRDRISNGLRRDDYAEQGVSYLTTLGTDYCYCIVNREDEPRELWGHLPRLAIELNNKEWEETLPEYRGLYCWEGGGKWLMEDAYRNCWGKEP